MRGECLAERIDVRRVDREPGGGAVAAVSLELPGGGPQPTEQVEGRDRPARAAGQLAGAVGQREHGRAVVALGDPRRDDADHARVPARRAEHVGGRRRLGVELRFSLEADPRLDVAALGVGVVELRRELGGAPLVIGHQQLERAVGAVEAPGGIEPGREPERHRALVQPQGFDTRDRHQRAQAGPHRRGQRAQALAHEAAVLAAQRHHVGNGRERDELEVAVALAAVEAGALAQRLRELRRDGRRAQLRARVAAQRRMQAWSIRQHAVLARAVVVGDEHVDARRARERDLLDGGDRAVGRDQQARSTGGEALDGV